MSSLKKEAVVAPGEWTPWEEKRTSNGKTGEMKPSRDLRKEEQVVHR
jgi:hypothetical protein